MKFPSFLLFIFLSSSLFAADHHGPSVDPDEALRRLIAGNQRYVAGEGTVPKSLTAHREKVAPKQFPFAVILGCADSRVPPEIVFDHSLGDLFVVRTAGNVPSNYDLASIEYSIKHLGSTLVVVLGHERCGAVDAAVENVKEVGHLPELLDEIQPAVAKARKQKGNLLQNAVLQNVRDIVARLKDQGPIIAKDVESGKIKVVGANYCLDTGKVTFLKPEEN
jgi:carbonic anhydrase